MFWDPKSFSIAQVWLEAGKIYDRHVKYPDHLPDGAGEIHSLPAHGHVS